MLGAGRFSVALVDVDVLGRLGWTVVIPGWVGVA